MARALSIEIVGDADKYRRELKSAAKASKTFEKQIDKTREHAGKFKGAIIGLGAGFLGANGLIAGAKKAIEAASNLNEQINKTGVVFGTSGQDIVKWSKTTAGGLGIARDQALEATGVFGNMLVPMGFARDKAAQMSKSMVSLSADMASFNNANPQDVLEALRSGLAGETEPLRKFGVFLSEARIKQEALAMGLIHGKQQLNAAGKAMATYRIIMKDTADAQGDFHRTSGGLANQQRILQARLRDLWATIGKELLPAVTKIVKQITTWMGKAENQRKIQHTVNEAIKTFSALVKTGWEWAKKFADAVGGWKNAFKIILTGLLVTKIAKVAGAIKNLGDVAAVALGKSAKGKAGGTGVAGLLGNLQLLGALGVVAVTVAVYEKLIPDFKGKHYSGVDLFKDVVGLVKGGDKTVKVTVPVIPAGLQGPIRGPAPRRRGPTSGRPGTAQPSRPTRTTFHALPARFQEGIESAQMTSGTRDDLKAYANALGFLRAELAKTHDVAKRVAIEKEINKITRAVNSINAEAAKAKMARIRDAFKTAWSRLGDQAGKAFDAVTERQMNKLAKAHEARLKQISDQLDETMAAIEGRRAALTPAEQELKNRETARAAAEIQGRIADAQQAMAGALQQEGETDQEFAARKLDLQKELNDALYDQRTAQLEAQAQVERDARDKQAADEAKAAQSRADAAAEAENTYFDQLVAAYQSERDLMKDHLNQLLALQLKYWLQKGELAKKARKDILAFIKAHPELGLTADDFTAAGKATPGPKGGPPTLSAMVGGQTVNVNIQNADMLSPAAIQTLSAEVMRRLAYA